MGTAGTTQQRRPEVSDTKRRFGKSPVSQFPPVAVIKPQSIPKYLPGGLKMTRSAPCSARRRACPRRPGPSVPGEALRPRETVLPSNPSDSGKGLCMKAFNNVFLRAPFAFALGSMTFTVGFLRLCVLSTRFTAGVIRGESPQAALARLTSEREMENRSRS